MPANNGIRLHKTDSTTPFRPAARKRGRESTVVRGEVTSTLPPLVNGQLVTEGEMLEQETSSLP